MESTDCNLCYYYSSCNYYGNLSVEMSVVE